MALDVLVRFGNLVALELLGKHDVVGVVRIDSELVHFNLGLHGGGFDFFVFGRKGTACR